MTHPRSLALFSVALLMTACGGGSAALVGTWKLDVEKAQNMPGLSAEDKAMLPMMGGMTLTITDSEIQMSMELMGQKQSETAKYKVKSQSGKSLVIETTDPKGKTEEAKAIVDGDSLTIEVDGKSMPFKRQ